MTATPARRRDGKAKRRRPPPKRRTRTKPDIAVLPGEPDPRSPSLGARGVPPFLAWKTEKLTPGQLTFCLEYLRNGFNATQAYLVAHPGVTKGSAATEGWRTLRRPNVRVFLGGRIEAFWKLLQMGGDEALARVATVASFDMRVLFDEQGNLKPPHEWPAEAGELVDAIEWEKGKVKVASRLAALRIILEQTGKLRSVGDSVDAVAAAIREDRKRHGGSDAE